MTVIINATVEGDLDEAVVRRLIRHVGAEIGSVYGRKGKGYIQEKIRSFNQAAHVMPWLVLVDLDNSPTCAPTMRRIWLPEPASNMCFRVAVREIEAWLLADREEAAAFLGVSPARIPSIPESENDPKRVIVDLAARSRRRGIQDDMTPRPGSGRAVGPAYDDRLVEFVEKHWRPDVAAEAADSLRRCLVCLRRLAGGQ